MEEATNGLSSKRGDKTEGGGACMMLVNETLVFELMCII